MHFRRLRLRFSEAVFYVSGICKANGVPQDKRLMRFFFFYPGGLFFIFPMQRVMISPTFGWQPGVLPPTMLNPIPVYTHFV